MKYTEVTKHDWIGIVWDNGHRSIIVWTGGSCNTTNIEHLIPERPEYSDHSIRDYIPKIKKIKPTCKIFKFYTRTQVINWMKKGKQREKKQS